jgi:hypothetical protein
VNTWRSRSLRQVAANRFERNAEPFVGKDPAHRHAEFAKVTHAPAQEVTGADAALVGLHLGVAQAGVVVDGHEQVFPARSFQWNRVGRR